MPVYAYQGGQAINTTSTPIKKVVHINEHKQGMIHATKINRKQMYVPDNNPQKPFEYYTSITNQSTTNYKLLHGNNVEFNSDGTISIGGYIAVAMGQSYGKPGDRFQITLSSGKTMSVIMTDAKQPYDTLNNDGWQGKNKHILEMVVWSASDSARGNLCFGGLNAYKGTVTSIYKET